MWPRLQARRIHVRPYCRRLFLRPSRRTFRIFRGCSRSHTGCISELLAERASVMLHLRCGCAGRRGRFTPDPTAEGISPGPSRRTFRIFRGFSRSHTCCISELLAERASVMLPLRCGCACRRGGFPPDPTAEGFFSDLPEGLSGSSAATAAATSSTLIVVSTAMA